MAIGTHAAGEARPGPPRHRGPAPGDGPSAVVDAQTILDAISLQVNLAYRGVVADQERVGLARPAVEQAAVRLTSLCRGRIRTGQNPAGRTSTAVAAVAGC